MTVILHLTQSRRVCYYSCMDFVTPFLPAVSATRSSSFFSRLPNIFSASFTSLTFTFGSLGFRLFPRG